MAHLVPLVLMSYGALGDSSISSYGALGDAGVARVARDIGRCREVPKLDFGR